MKLLILSLSAVIATALSARESRPDSVQRLTPGCAHGENVSEFLDRAKLQGELGALADLGVTVRPTTAVLLTNNALCDSIIIAHNALVAPDSEFTITTTAPLIARIGTSYILSMHPIHGNREFMFVYDSARRYRMTLASDCPSPC